VSNGNPGGEVDLFYRVPLAWSNNVVVTQTFATRDSQNAWAYFQGSGWRKIQTGSPDGITNMLAVFAQAVAKNKLVTIYADGNFVYQAYLL
jgi:astacin